MKTMDKFMPVLGELHIIIRYTVVSCNSKYMHCIFTRLKAKGKYHRPPEESNVSFMLDN